MPNTHPPAIRISGLHKSFKDNRVLRGIDLDIPSGTVFALLGPNGAGKTTVINILTTLLAPDAGTVRVAGHDVVADPDAVRASIGVTGQFAAVDALLTGEENLRMMARLAHLDKKRAKTRIAELLDRFDLADARYPSGGYSGGMRRRLDLAMSLMLDPDIVFLDEPTTGVDPRGRVIMWDIVRDLAEQGTTIFLTTQYLEEADQLASRVAVLAEGRIVADGTPAELKRRVGSGHLVLELPTPEALDTAARLLPAAMTNAGTLSLRVNEGTDPSTVRDLLVRLDDARVPVANLEIVTPDLDDVFFSLTGAPRNRTDTIPENRA
ncbi:ATP-binding cassette domain-containing protein [Nocardiopsis sp. NPDC057823]|uniref:ATP-binding cassette domain-containing protein n=1 Tax=Nocardiopsis sp. NPDC057823 TaxID=3346256 RepID=UPI003671AE0C